MFTLFYVHTLFLIYIYIIQVWLKTNCSLTFVCHFSSPAFVAPVSPSGSLLVLAYKQACLMNSLLKHDDSYLPCFLGRQYTSVPSSIPVLSFFSWIVNHFIKVAAGKRFGGLHYLLLVKDLNVRVTSKVRRLFYQQECNIKTAVLLFYEWDLDCGVVPSGASQCHDDVYSYRCTF